MATTQFAIHGLTCGHCVAAVEDEISALPGVRDIRIDLVAGGTSTAHVDSDSPLEVDVVRAAVDEAGYTLLP